ncbi:MAG: hypothetical protein K8F52_05550 [Candidatus Scalindua rubra]|uniref:Uncharacterized protein n=1 Tax=Candidatus Scalindua brodae TaxID=237368 RepID=A0A0B0EQJ4_9BACT|nr:MAG: hypothetical protein SCABRO_00829 [Candidatus Scalindua brodae]MBZ0108112.1 hypothetical protein [Candidatus Scalindua rubra]TWU31270.1 hypothetical protein S225a_22160 [Candidatus Brocadiaceae bacterium S225]
MKCIMKVKIVLAVFVSLACIDGLILKSVHAQHTDVFNLYKDKGPEKDSNTKEVTPDAPEVEWIEVENHVRYKVSVEKGKYEAKDLAMADIELWEIVDKTPFEWHQVDFYLEGDIEEIHTRDFGKQGCIRKRKGSLFWLKDGKKCVYWTPWSTWDCRPEEERDIAIYP